MAEKSLIFIPDISGFTKFVTETEINHSQHIISELIEVILNSNRLNMEVSEIEGDAVLYFRTGELPTINELLDQTKHTFIEFHSFLKSIERDNVCQCGACQSASHLTLKFIAHSGEIQKVAIQNFNKLMGGAVILAHRLLKANVESNEYLLCTEDYLQLWTEEKDFEDWVNIKKHIEIYENFGEVKTGFVSLNGLHKQVPKTEDKLENSQFDFLPDISLEINAPIKLVHNILIDNELKKEWVPGLKTVQAESPINRINSTHKCEFDNLEIHFVTLANKKENKTIRYSESGELQTGLSIINDYLLTEVNGRTLFSLRILPGRINDSKLNWFQKLIGSIKIRLLILITTRSRKKGLQEFKKYCEKIARKEK